METSPIPTLAPLSTVPAPPCSRRGPVLTGASQEQHTRLLTILSRITRVRVTHWIHEHGHRYFVLDIRGPSAFSDRFRTTPRPSKYRYSEVLDLKRGLYYHAYAGHRDHTRLCTFCQTVVETLTHLPALPRIYKSLFSHNNVLCQELEVFLQVILTLALTAKHNENRTWCEGREMTLLLVKQFLLGDDGEVDMSVERENTIGWN